MFSISTPALQHSSTSDKARFIGPSLKLLAPSDGGEKYAAMIFKHRSS